MKTQIRMLVWFVAVSLCIIVLNNFSKYMQRMASADDIYWTGLLVVILGFKLNVQPNNEF